MYSEEYLRWDIQRKIMSVPFLPPKDPELRRYWSIAMRRCMILFVVLIGSLLFLSVVAEFVDALT
jgi:hypothetical protein